MSASPIAIVLIVSLLVVLLIDGTFHHIILQSFAVIFLYTVYGHADAISWNVDRNLLQILSAEQTFS